MKQIYQELFDHVAFPVLATDPNGIVIYKNPQSRKYHADVRCRAMLQKHLQPNTLPHEILLTGETPFSVGARLSHRENTLCLFLSRFQQADGRQILESMISTFGADAEHFLPQCHHALKNTSSTARTYSDLVLITEREVEDFRTAPQSLDTPMRLFFEKLSCFSVLGYRIDARSDENFSPRCAVRTTPQELLHRVSHWLYLMMKLSQSKAISIRLSTDADEHHVFSVCTQTALASALYEKEALTALVPECEMEMKLLSALSDFTENVSLSVSESGMARLTWRIPCESALRPLCLHSGISSSAQEKLAKAFAAKLFKKIAT